MSVEAGIKWKDRQIDGKKYNYSSDLNQEIRDFTDDGVIDKNENEVLRKVLRYNIERKNREKLIIQNTRKDNLEKLKNNIGISEIVKGYLEKIFAIVDNNIEGNFNKNKDINGNTRDIDKGIPVSETKNTQDTNLGSDNENNEVYSDISKMFGEWLESHAPKGRPRGNCGLGVYNNINNFFRKELGIKKAIKVNSGRHGYKWGDILEDPSNLDPRIKVTRTPIKSPSDAPIGSIMYYKKGKEYLGSKGKQRFGHVEILGANGRCYYDGEARKPGGSAANMVKNNYQTEAGLAPFAYVLDLKSRA